MNTFLIILAVLCCIPGAFFLKKHLMIRSAAKELGLIDRGLIKSTHHGDDGKIVWLCNRCKTRTRIGILKTARHPVTWCYVCIRMWGDQQGGGGSGGQEGLPPDPSPEGEPVSPEVVKQTREVLERFGRNTTPN